MLFKELSQLFEGMSIITMGCLLLGVMLIVVEFFQPTHYIAGGVGFGLTVVGCVLRMFAGGTIGMLFLLVSIIVVIVFLCHILVMYLHKKDWLMHSLSLMISKDELIKSVSFYDFLVGKIGITTTPVNLTGNMSIADTNFLVSSMTTIGRNEKVKVVEVDGDKIIVERA